MADNRINPYDQASWSTYTPLTSQEILMPALMMRERHDKLDEEYASINDELNKVAFIAEHENDPAIKQQYNNYMNNLTSSRDELMNRGITSSSRRKMLNLRGQYQSQIQPINLGYQLKMQDINKYNDMITKDPTYLGMNPSQRTVSDYIGNGLQPFIQQGISGSLLTKMTSDYLTPYSQDLTDTEMNNLLTELVGDKQVPQYMEYIKQYGYKPGTKGHEALIEAARQKVMIATGISSWANQDQLNQANQYINLAATQTIGKDQSQILNNNAYLIALQKQEAKERALAMENERIAAISPIPIPGEVAMSDIDRTNLDNFKKSLKNDDAANDEAYASAQNYDDFLKNLKSQGSNQQSYQQITSLLDRNETKDFNSWGFNPVKAAFELNDKFKGLSEEQRQDLIRQTLPDASSDDVLKYAAMGVGGYAMAAKLALSRGVPWATVSSVGKNIGKLSLPLIAGGLFAQPSNAEDVNREQFLVALGKINNKVHAQYSNIKKSLQAISQNLSDDDIINIMERDITNRSKVAQEVFNYNQDVVNTYQLREAKNYITDLRNSGGIVTEVDKKGNKKQIKASNINKELKEDVLKIITDPDKVNFKGQISLNRNFGNKPTYQFTKTIGDKTYYIDVPASTLDSDYNTSRAIYSVLDKGDTKIETVQTPEGDLTLVPNISKEGIKWIIVPGKHSSQQEINNAIQQGNYTTPEAFLMRDRMNVGNRYFNREATRKEY